MFFANLGANEHMSIVGWPFPSISHTQYHPWLLKISRALPPFQGGKCLLQGGQKVKNAAKRFNCTILFLVDAPVWNPDLSTCERGDFNRFHETTLKMLVATHLFFTQFRCRGTLRSEDEDCRE